MADLGESGVMIGGNIGVSTIPVELPFQRPPTSVFGWHPTAESPVGMLQVWKGGRLVPIGYVFKK